MRRPKGKYGLTRPPAETTPYDIYRHARDTSTKLSPLEISKLLFEAAFLSLLAVDPDTRNPFVNWVFDTAHEDLKNREFVDYADGLAEPGLLRTYQGKEMVPAPQYTPGTTHKPKH